jgi:hypothetical protein
MNDNRENVEIIDTMIANAMKRIKYYNTLKDWPILNITPEKSIAEEMESIENFEDLRRCLIQERWTNVWT